MNIFGRILKKGDFWPLFGAQALGAFNDNFFRQALIAYVAFGAAGLSGPEKTIVGALATGLMMLPFFLFSSLAGELADRRRKSSLVRVTKAAELPIMILAALFFYLGEVKPLLALLFLMGAQSTFFGPVKYGLLPEILDEKDLVGGNGLVEASTFLAIVLGTLAGSWLVTAPDGPTLYLPAGLILVSALGLGLALRQPDSLDGDRTLKVDGRIWDSTRRIIGSVMGRQDMWLAILAISWFWAMGGILLTQIPVLCSTVMGGTRGVNTFLSTLFALGVGLGSIGTQWVLKGQISARLVPVSAAFLSLFLILLAWCVWRLPPVDPILQPVTLEIFLSHWPYLRLALCCLLVSLTGGLFVVPLNAFIQHRAEVHERSRVIAANNIMNALFICLGSLVVMLMTALGFGLHQVFVFVALSAVLTAVLTLYFLPAEGLRQLSGFFLKLLYRPKVTGLEHLAGLKDGPALIVANHSSFLDVVLLIVYLPRRLTFAIDSYWSRAWWLKPFLRVFQALPVNPNQPLATRGLIEALNQGELVVIFPEGRITTTGNLMKVYDGPGLIAAKSKAPILPVVIGGAQYSRFGRMRQVLRHLPRKKVTMTVMAPRQLQVRGVAGEKQRDQRRRAGEALYELMLNCRFQALDHHKNLWPALRETSSQCGPGRLILEDAAREPISYRGLIFRARVLGRRLSAVTRPGENVGLMLPNSTATVCALFGLWAGGRTAVMLNHSQGPAPLASAVLTARIKTVLTSRRFLASAGLEELAAGLPARLLYLEDLNISRLDKLRALFWRGRPAPADSPAVLVFTSGSEGKPKGVALSHRNILANIHQLVCQVEVNEDDLLFNALPMFHAFGLTVGVMLPLLSGLRCFNYVSPLHPKIIPELIYDSRATMTVASDTFASAWGRNAHPYDFSSIRIMLVGAEKLKPKTRALYFDKLGVRIFEGYGATECTPVLAVNSHLAYRAGTVGRILPGLSVRLDPVEGVAEGGRLVVKGPNVMLGYLWPDNPGVIVPPEGGWYDTGDIVEIDEDGFVWIKGRFKRFAKIGGEMVSLAAVEEVAAQLWPGRPQAVIAMDDESKGEKLVYVTEEARPDLPRLWQALKEAGLPELSYPRQFIRLPEIPMTPLGKINLPRLIEAAREAGVSG
ncbi:MAG: MFS transporter [Candidatus Adiutrix sp.]|jgi:acyl-[acyl-carrier-protein]-phospholipid O-acyltransferase/long-chain-fatty-acid--[acyl-carrier-protein] ligase|nr:MFS transporter [Candidatus Adiutrix sp.]